MDRFIAAEALEAPFLEHAQQLGLCHQRHVADFIEEERAAVGKLQAPRLAIVGAGEGAFFVAEDFRLEQAVGQGRAVDRLEIFGRASRQLVDHARHDFLAGAGRAEDQHRDVGLRGGADPLEDGEHLLVAADHLSEALHRRRGFLDAEIGAALEEDFEELGDRLLLRRDGTVGGRIAGDFLDDAELDELVDAVIDVEAHAPERLHDGVAVEGLARPRRQEAQDAGAQRRLDQRLEPGLEVGRIRARALPGAARGERQFIHDAPPLEVLRRLRRRGLRRGGPGRACDKSPSGNARSTASSVLRGTCGARGRLPRSGRRSSR